MKTKIPYFHLAYTLFYLSLLVFFVFFDSLGQLFNLSSISPGLVSKIVLLSFILFLINWAVEVFHSTKANKKILILEKEIQYLKAKLDREGKS